MPKKTMKSDGAPSPNGSMSLDEAIDLLEEMAETEDGSHYGIALRTVLDHVERT